jgi:hypothetical protein
MINVLYQMFSYVTLDSVIKKKTVNTIQLRYKFVPQYSMWKFIIHVKNSSLMIEV